MVKLLYILYGEVQIVFFLNIGKVGEVQIVSMFISSVFLVNAQTFDWTACFTRILPQKIAFFHC